MESAYLLLFVVATAVAITARRLRIPYTVLLVVAGIVLGNVHAFAPPHLTKELLFAVFLPGLIFEAAFHVDADEFQRNRGAIAALAVPGVVIATGLTAALLVLVGGGLGLTTGFGWGPALVFGAIVAATDPIAVVALFKSLGAPKRLGILVEGESLLNDGTSVVFFTILLGAVAGTAVTASGLAVTFLLTVGVGALVGTAMGLAASTIIRRVDDAMIEITVTTIAAYGSFVLAEELHYSGVIATVVAGMLCGNYAARTGMSPTTRVAVETFWEYVAFALNSIVFLLIGFEVQLSRLLDSWLVILAAFVAVVAGRAVVIGVVSALLRPTRERLPRKWTPVLLWGGLKGGLSMVLVLSVPRDFPFRDLLVTMTFGVVVLSILVQGLTISPLMRWLGVITGRDEHREYEERRGELQVLTGALREIDAMGSGRFAHPRVITELRSEYETRARDVEQQLLTLHVEQEELLDLERRHSRRHLLLVERDNAIRAFREGMVGQDVYERLTAQIDARLLEVESD